MPTAKRILVFPCGSEIGLEIHRSLRFSTHFELVGASSVEDHGRFVYERYIDGLPFHHAPDFVEAMARVVREQRIDAIYPAMDAVADTLQQQADRIGCKVIGSGPDTTAACASKTATYQLLNGRIPLAQRFADTESAQYPIFIKPDRGYGARNSLRADSAAQAQAHLARHAGQAMLLQEYLPGREWTIDCFSDRHGALRFHCARGRDRVSNGISVRTSPSADFQAEFAHWAQQIHQALQPRGAWFFQAREDAQGRPRLLEVAARLGGSSGLFRCMGVNFALLSAFDAFDGDVSITPNAYPIVLDRALDNRYRIAIQYSQVFVDLDDCLLVQGRVNHQLVGYLYKAISDGKRITLLTRHKRPPEATLREYRLQALFDRVIHLSAEEKKSDHIDCQDAIFIDDSFAERQEVAQRKKIPVFAPDMVEALL
ncbi:ATP-grasp domain-containing protein [Comamonas granuli]|uniref:ATP-grasp domain-containing protein n=1 Tax=Comamonas granuli TaxID=290309 RepID=UPI0005A91D55|nr:ATP-grasp domain-containing protein [Comamonas granuli]